MFLYWLLNEKLRRRNRSISKSDLIITSNISDMFLNLFQRCPSCCVLHLWSERTNCAEWVERDRARSDSASDAVGITGRMARINLWLDTHSFCGDCGWVDAETCEQVQPDYIHARKRFLLHKKSYFLMWRCQIFNHFSWETKRESIDLLWL